MRPIFRNLSAIATSLPLIVTGLPSSNSAKADDMMASCQDAIQMHCSTVSEGRGRITACLFAHIDKLADSCRLEVDQVTDGSILETKIPDRVRKISGTKQEEFLRVSCSDDVQKLCSEVSGGEVREFACLYARSSDISSVCSYAMKAVLDRL